MKHTDIQKLRLSESQARQEMQELSQHNTPQAAPADASRYNVAYAKWSHLDMQLAAALKEAP